VGWSITEVARTSGVTARTLRHYDSVGLLVPAYTSASGRRFYEREQLLRLQRILLLRELGMGLEEIARTLESEGSGPPLAALRRHLDWLAGERDRYERLMETVRATIETVERGGDMSPERMFSGFEHNPYEAEARERWGDGAVDRANERIRGWSADQAQQAATGFGRVHAGLAELRAAGAAVDDPRVQALIDEHYRTVCLFWTPDAEAYRGLGLMYVEDERFRQNIGQGDDALVEFLRDAMAVYADTRPA
jgi:MerR family transcriptional regulator, thiopeptide resistance regulator